MSSDAMTLDQIVEQRRLGGDLAAQVDEKVTRMVLFTVGERLFAVAGASIREILPLGGIAFVPGCPPSMLGVINVRGDIESVISLAAVLGLGQGKASRHSSIMLAMAGGMRSGLAVDAIIDVAEVPESAVQPPPATTPAALENIVTGTVMHRGAAATLIELDRLFQEFTRGLG